MSEERTCSKCGCLHYASESSVQARKEGLCKFCNPAKSELRTKVETAGCALFGVGYFFIILLGGVIHVWTILIAFQESGLPAAVLALFLPVLAQIYWFFDVMSSSGTVANTYCLSILAYVAFMGLTFLIIAATSNSSE